MAKEPVTSPGRPRVPARASLSSRPASRGRTAGSGRRWCPRLGVGHDALALAGLLALARFAVAAASWDVANGFSLMGASRDLTIAVFTEVTLVLSLAVAALVAGTTDLRGMIAAHRG